MAVDDLLKHAQLAGHLNCTVRVDAEAFGHALVDQLEDAQLTSALSEVADKVPC